VGAGLTWATVAQAAPISGERHSHTLAFGDTQNWTSSRDSGDHDLAFPATRYRNCIVSIPSMTAASAPRWASRDGLAARAPRRSDLPVAVVIRTTRTGTGRGSFVMIPSSTPCSSQAEVEGVVAFQGRQGNGAVSLFSAVGGTISRTRAEVSAGGPLQHLLLL